MPDITTYEPDNSLKKGYSTIFREIWQDLKNNRWLTWQLFRRDFFGAYKQSVMGILWIFIMPLGNVLVFVLLNNAGVFDFGTLYPNIHNIIIPYPVYAIVGMTFWQLFAAGLISGSAALVGAGSMLTQINFSKKSLVLSSVARSIVSFLIMLFMVIAVFVYYYAVQPDKISIRPGLTVLMVPLLLVPLVFLSLGLAFILSIFNVMVRDIAQALSLLLMFLMFLTPVLYATPTAGILATITNYNPLYYLLAAPRDLIFAGTMFHWVRTVLSAVFCFVIFVIGIMVFHLSESRVGERV